MPRNWERPGSLLLRRCTCPRSVDKDTPLEELGVEQAELDETVAHLASHRGRALKYYVFAALSLFGVVWLTRLGRPDGSPNSDRKSWYPRTPYLVALVVSVVVAGFWLGKSPNPMEGAVKIFKGMVGLQPSMVAVVLAFVFFVGLAILANNIVCGWACPFGALQELIYSLPILRKLKKRKVPFVVSNAIRSGLFVLMLLMLFGVLGGKKGFVVYHFMNPFNLFNLRFETPTILLTVILSIGLALVVYRPYCQFICPFGFVSWLAERVSFIRVRIDHDRCNGCGACSRACPPADGERPCCRKNRDRRLLQLRPLFECLSRGSNWLQIGVRETAGRFSRRRRMIRSQVTSQNSRACQGRSMGQALTPRLRRQSTNDSGPCVQKTFFAPTCSTASSN